MEPLTFIDTHCHIHDSDFYVEGRESAYEASRVAGVSMICVGVDTRSSIEAIEFSRTHEECYAVIGIHPHEAAINDAESLRELLIKDCKDVIGIGEIGLDYYYDNSPREAQQLMLHAQLALAKEFDLPVSFHVRDVSSPDDNNSVWNDFWPIYDQYCPRGVLHSFTDSKQNYEEAVKRGLFIGVNGISTFTRDSAQQALFAEIPLSRIVLETDAPFLTPKPFRGKMNLPAYVREVAAHQAGLKAVSLDDVAHATSHNARELFGL